MGKLTQKEKSFFTGLVGTILGVGLSLGALCINSPTERVRSIEKKDMPRIMKVYNEFLDTKIRSAILVEDPDIAGEYIPLSVYLEKEFDNKYERNLERARIKLSVSQGENKK
jgi:hypothetical protein